MKIIKLVTIISVCLMCLLSCLAEQREVIHRSRFFTISSNRIKLIDTNTVFSDIGEDLTLELNKLIVSLTCVEGSDSKGSEILVSRSLYKLSTEFSGF